MTDPINSVQFYVSLLFDGLIISDYQIYLYKIKYPSINDLILYNDHLIVVCHNSLFLCAINIMSINFM